MKTLLKKLKKIVKKHGYSYVAFKLGYRDTGAIKKWFKRESIPQIKIESIRAFINNEA